MRNSIFSAATLSALAFALVGVTSAGRVSPAMQGLHAQSTTSSSTEASSKGVGSKSGSHSPGSSKQVKEGDPVVNAGALAKREAENTLKDQICSFLAEYGEPDTEMLEAQKHGAKPNNTYCELKPGVTGHRVRKVGANAPAKTDGGAIDPAIRPKVVIAVLPDPVHTQLALRFDESVDELQNSMQDLGWTYDRAWLPWDNKEHELASDFDKRMENKIAQESYEKSPGAIMFRGVDATGEPRQLIVLVVGDTPTGGIHREPFLNALKIWKSLTGWNSYMAQTPQKKRDTKQWADASHLEILGPTYSGSIPSLRAMLRDLTLNASDGKSADPYSCTKRPLKIAISSPTISDSQALKNLQYRDEHCANLSVRAASMAVDLLYQYIRVMDFLDHHKAMFAVGDSGPLKIARLTETESVYGNYGAQATLEPTEDLQSLLADRKTLLAKDADARAKMASSTDQRVLAEARMALLADDERASMVSFVDDVPRELNAANLSKRLAPLQFRFPRELSKLRAAYEQSNIFGFTSNTSAVQTQLHLSLSGSTREDDTVHTFSGTQSASEMESAMGLLASELEREKVRIVILSATDVLDEIFLTKYLGQHAPNISVIVTDTDALFLRGAESSLENAYVISPWSLIPGNERWSLPKPDAKTPWNDGVLPKVHLHNSAGAQGLYSATLFLMCWTDPHPPAACGAVANPDKSDTWHPFLRHVALPEYQPPVATYAATTNDLVSEPPLWLSVVGRGGFWPISLVDVDQRDDGMPESESVNLPRLIKINTQSDGHEAILPPPVSRGIQEREPISIPIFTGIIVLLLLWHGMACFRARLDRGFAWSYALAHEQHHTVRNILQLAITLATIPGLVLLKTPVEPGIDIRTPLYTALNWLLQIVVILLALRPSLRLFGVESWAGIKANRRRALLLSLGWLAVGAAYLAFANWFTWFIIAPPANKWPSEHAFFFYRSGHLFSGSSPALPILLLGGALVLFLISLFERLVFYDKFIPRLPKDSLHAPGPLRTERLTQFLSKPLSVWNAAVFGIVLLVLALFLVGMQEAVPRSLAHGRFDIVLIVMSGVVVVLLMNDLGTAITSWFLLRADCLLPLQRSPIRWGFTWIKGWSWKRLWAPGAAAEARFDYAYRLTEANGRELEDPYLTNAFVDVAQMRSLPDRGSTWAAALTNRIGVLNERLADSATDRLAALNVLWSYDRGPITGSDLHARGMQHEIALDKLQPGTPLSAEWKTAHDRMAMEEFVALLYLGYIRMVLLQIRTRIITATGMYILLLWALTSYPFLNHHSIIIGLTCLLIALATSVIWMYSQMHRDEILSRTTEGTPGKLDTDFFTKILSMVGIPALTLIASQFPEVSNTIFSWLEPGLSSIK